MVDWIHSNLHIDVIKYMTDSHVYTSNDVIQVMNELMKQGVSQTVFNSTTHIMHQLYQIYLQKVISTINTVMHHLLTGRLRRHLKPIQRSYSSTSTNLKQI